MTPRMLLSLFCLGLTLLAAPSQARLRNKRSPELNSFASNPLTGLWNALTGETSSQQNQKQNYQQQAQFVPRVQQSLDQPPSRGNNGFSFSKLAPDGRTALDFHGITSGSLQGIAPIPVPSYPGPQDVPVIPGVNTIPGLDMFNYLVGTLIPQAVPSANKLLSGSITRLLPQEGVQNIASDVFKQLHPAAADVEVDRMMGRWFQVINSPHVIREACTVSHFGALTNNSYSATFTVLKFYREGNPNGPPRFALGYGFKAGNNGQFVVHNSNSPDSEPFWVIKAGPLNSFNQYDYAVVSNWVRFPVFVIARDPQRFQRLHMREVLEYLEKNNYINFLTKAFNMISPVDYSSCQYTPTFSGAGK